MNPSLKLLLLLLIALEISFTNRLSVNLLLICCLLVVLLWQKISWQQLLWVLFIPLIPGLAVMITIGYFSNHDWWTAWVLLSRFYVYVLAGGTLVFTTNNLNLIRSLEQNCHLSSKFAYGTLAALNLLPIINRSLHTIKMAGQMRGVSLHWWSPTLYFKAILSALRWSDQLAQAMEIHGFRERQQRTHATVISITSRDWTIFIGSLLLLQIAIIALP